MEVCAPELADLPIRIKPRHAAPNPLWWSSSAVVDDRFVLKFAWSEIRAVRLWREGVVLERLGKQEPLLALPELVVLSRDPALVVTRRLPGVPLSWEWVDDVLHGQPMALPTVLVHGELHGYNQVWAPASASLLAVVDFEGSGIADGHFDLRYLPGNSQGPQLVLAVMARYEQLSGRRLSVERVMAWHVLTALGDAMWRTEAGVALPGGGTATTYVDRLSPELAALELD